MYISDCDLDIVDDFSNKGFEDALVSLVVSIRSYISTGRMKDFSILEFLMFGSLGSLFVFCKVDFGLGSRNSQEVKIFDDDLGRLGGELGPGYI